MRSIRRDAQSESKYVMLFQNIVKNALSLDIKQRVSYFVVIEQNGLF